MNVRLMLLAVLLMVPLVQIGRAQQPQGKFEPVGRWRFFHTDGTPFTARLAPDHSAATDWEGGEHGIWRWEGSTVRVIYTDGWDDQLVQTANRVFVKRGWSPEADRCGPASNQTGAERISNDPGPPL